MRIVHIITRFIRGGADENTLLTVNGQAKLGHEVHLLYGEHHPAMVEALDPRVIAVFEPSLIRAVRPATDLTCLGRIRRYLKRTAPDVVHTHESKAGVIGRAAAWSIGTRPIVHTVHILPFIGVSRAAAAVFLALEKAAARFTDAFIDVSPGMRDMCLQHGLGTADNHFVIESGMDVGRFREAAPLAELAGEKGVVTGLIAGTLEQRKRIGPFIVELARARATGWRLLIAGDGIERNGLEVLIQKLGLQDRVLLLGHRSDLEQLIATADICVHAAKNEGLPRVVVQYVLAGRPVIATRLAGIDRVVVEGRNGLLVEGDDLEGLASAFLSLVDDAGERARMAAASREIDLAAWDHEAMVASIEQVYSLAVSRSRRATS